MNATLRHALLDIQGTRRSRCAFDFLFGLSVRGMSVIIFVLCPQLIKYLCVDRHVYGV